MREVGTVWDVWRGSLSVIARHPLATFVPAAVITYANLTGANPTRFVNVSDSQVTKLNGTVGRIIR